MRILNNPTPTLRRFLHPSIVYPHAAMHQAAALVAFRVSVSHHTPRTASRPSRTGGLSSTPTPIRHSIHIPSSRPSLVHHHARVQTFAHCVCRVRVRVDIVDSYKWRQAHLFWLMDGEEKSLQLASKFAGQAGQAEALYWPS
jgi:hypothetical protein